MLGHDKSSHTGGIDFDIRSSMNNKITFKNNETQTLANLNEDFDSIKWHEFVSLMLNNIKPIAKITAVVIAISAAVLFIIPSEYRSKASILPSGAQNKLAEFKSLAGLNMNSTATESSSMLFPVILKSKEIEKSVLEETYRVEINGETISMTLTEYFDETDPDKLSEEMSDIFSVATDKKNGVIRLGVTTEYPQFSQAVLTSYLGALEDFNLNKRSSQAKQNEKYLSFQLSVKKKELQQAENKLIEFQNKNRDWHMTSNPDVLIALARHKRDVQVLNQATIFLTREYEMAKFDSQKDIPIIQVLDSPTLATRKIYPRRAFILLIITFLTLFIATIVVLVKYSMQKRATASDLLAIGKLRKDFATTFPRVSRRFLKESSKETTTI